MRKYVMILGMMVVSTFIFAQSKRSPNEQADRMKKELALDDVQFKSVNAINEEYAGKMEELKKDTAISKESRHEQMRTLHREKNVAIRKILTPEQSTKWAALGADKKGTHPAKARRSYEDHAVRMQKDLSLTDEQTAEIETIHKEFASKFDALKRDSTLARDNARDKGHQLRKEYLSKTKAVLTEEQIARWEAQQAERRKKKH
jgi:Spy/CpxP family protein refolding chaperone